MLNASYLSLFRLNSKLLTSTDPYFNLTKKFMMSDATVLKLVSSNKCFNGQQNVYEHARYNNQLNKSLSNFITLIIFLKAMS